MKGRNFNLKWHYAPCCNIVLFILKDICLISPPSLVQPKSRNTSKKHLFIKEPLRLRSHLLLLQTVLIGTGFPSRWQLIRSNKLEKLQITLLQTGRLRVPRRHSFWCKAVSGKGKVNLKAGRILSCLESLSLVYLEYSRSSAC